MNELIKDLQKVDKTLKRLTRLATCVYYSNHYKTYRPCHNIKGKEVYERMFLIKEYLNEMGYNYTGLEEDYE